MPPLNIPKPLPMLGSRVHYVYGAAATFNGGKAPHRPAEVVHVADGPKGIVALSIKTAGRMDGFLDHAPVIVAHDVRHDPTGADNTWHWPEGSAEEGLGDLQKGQRTGGEAAGTDLAADMSTGGGDPDHPALSSVPGETATAAASTAP